MPNLKNMTRKFLLGEWTQNASPASHLQGLKEVLQNMRPRTLSEKRRLEVAMGHLREIRRSHKRLEEKLHILEEQVKIIEEQKGD